MRACAGGPGGGGGGGAGGGAGAVEVMLVSSRRKPSEYVFPKGGWETDEALEDAAARETVEEAGVRGSLEALDGPRSRGGGASPSPEGGFLFTSKRNGSCRAHMFVMHVVEELDVWPECGQRQRAWFSLPKARAALRKDWMRAALDSLEDMLAGGRLALAVP